MQPVRGTSATQPSTLTTHDIAQTDDQGKVMEQQAAEAPDKGWSQVVSRNSRRSLNKARRETAVIGKATGISITAIKRKRFANVFATRFPPNVEAAEVKSYLEKELGFQINCKKLISRFPQEYSSFNITAQCNDPAVFMNSDLWPEHCLVRWFRPPKKVDNTNNLMTRGTLGRHNNLRDSNTTSTTNSSNLEGRGTSPLGDTQYASTPLRCTAQKLHYG